MIKEIKDDICNQMNNCIEIFKKKISEIQIGRISPSIFDKIKIKYRGSLIPFKNLASVVTSNLYTLKIHLFNLDTKIVVQKAIIASNADLLVKINNDDIYVSLPPLTEDRRKELVKIIKNITEQNKVLIRNIRRDFNLKIKSLLKQKIISKDDEYRVHDFIQKITDASISKINTLLTNKETEIMSFKI